MTLDLLGLEPTPPEVDLARDPVAAAVLSVLRRGELLSDATFDAIYDPRWQALSSQHWTPIEVADIAIRWLTEAGARRVLDIGAGVGKLCIYGALATDDVAMVGIEQRAELVDAARRAATRLGVASRARFRHGTIETIDPTEFDALYLFNPFGENLCADASERIDGAVELGRERYERDVRTVERWLRALPVGARVVTHHGFGGMVPDSFRLVASHQIGWDGLRAWEKHRVGKVMRIADAEKKRR